MPSSRGVTRLAVLAAGFSLLMSVIGWPESRIGVLFNIVILALSGPL